MTRYRSFLTYCKKKGYSFLLLAALCYSGMLQAQSKATENVAQLWLGYFNQVRLSEKWGIAADLHLRTLDHMVSGLSIGIVRAGLVYHLNEQTRLVAGYAYVHNFPIAPHDHIGRPEHRPWQMIQWNTKYPAVQLTQNLRLEQRFRRKVLNADALADGYNFNVRLRYNFLLQVPLGRHPATTGGLSWLLNDEIHVNAGREIVFNYFDQNRFFTGLNYRINRTDQLQFGYTHVFLQLPAGNRYRSTHGLRIYYLQQLDLRAR